uniref:Uncharacterized protein n=1 Tax=Panagrolaimus superbus TaxID=310955 RepID=A0A914Y3P3_9BILA
MTRARRAEPGDVHADGGLGPRGGGAGSPGCGRCRPAAGPPAADQAAADGGEWNRHHRRWPPRSAAARCQRPAEHRIDAVPGGIGDPAVQFTVGQTVNFEPTGADQGWELKDNQGRPLEYLPEATGPRDIFDTRR